MKRTVLSASTLALVAITVSAAVGTSGCFWVTTKHEGEELRKQVDQLNQKVSSQQQSVDTQVARLKDVLDQATKLLARNSADLGADVSSMQEEQQKLNGLVMDAQRTAEDIHAAQNRQAQQLADLEKRLAEVEAKLVQTTKTADQLWSEGMADLRAGKLDDGRAALHSLIVKYPGDGKADNAQYQLAESFFKEKKYNESLRQFQAVFEKYPQSSLADDAAYHAGEAAEQLKWCTDARAYFGLLVKNWPKSNLARKARAQDARLKKLSHNKKKCQS